MSTVYKIVKLSRLDGLLRSAYTPENLDKLSLVYKAGEVTVPHMGYIMAFESRKAACNYVDGMTAAGDKYFQVWKAEAETIYRDINLLPSIWDMVGLGDVRGREDDILRYIERFWNRNNTPYHSILPTIWIPVGTVFCTKLTLLERILRARRK